MEGEENCPDGRSGGGERQLSKLDYACESPGDGEGCPVNIYAALQEARFKT